MTGIPRILVGLAVRFSPGSCRAVRREQWLADLRDAPELGLSPLTVAVGALTTTAASRGPASGSVQKKKKTTTKETAMMFHLSPIARLGLGTLTASVVLAGGLSVGIGWASSSIQRGPTGATGADGGAVVYATLDDDPPAEVVDLSTLIIAGYIDPASGEVTETTPHPAVGAD